MDELNKVERFITNGSYQIMLENKKRLKLLRNQIREYQSEVGHKRMHWYAEGVIGIFESVGVFDEDTAQLKDYLKQLGLLPMVTTVSWGKLTPQEQSQVIPYVIILPSKIKFSPKGNLKADTDTQKLNSFDMRAGVNNISDTVMHWKQVNNFYQQLQREWNLIKAQISHDLKNHELIRFNHGSILCTPSESILSGRDIYRVLGGEVLMRSGRVDHEKIMALITRGLLKKKDFLVYRKLIDVRTRYLLIEVEKYNRRINYYHQKLIQISTMSEMS